MGSRVSVESGRPLSGRWLMLPLLVLGFVEATFNWFNVVDAFGDVDALFRVGVTGDGLLVGAFFAGYGISHIPVGLLSNRFGFKNVLLAGFLVESAGSALSGLAPNYAFLVGARVASGVGAAFVVVTCFALTNVWFRGAELGFANGLAGGAGFAVGAAAVLQYGVAFVSALGWRHYFLMTGVVGLLMGAIVVGLVRIPAHEGRLAGGRISGGDLKEVFYNRDLWMLGLSMVGGYGAYFAASELLPQYAGGELHFSAGFAAATGTLALLMGIPGSVVGGVLADRARRAKLVYGVFQALAGLGFFSVLADPSVTVWFTAAVVGFSLIAAFSVYTAVPGIMGNISSHNLGLAAGLLLSLAAVGGFSVPTVFGVLAASGYSHAWVFLGAVTLALLVFALFMGEPFKARVGVKRSP